MAIIAIAVSDLATEPLDQRLQLRNISRVGALFLKFSVRFSLKIIRPAHPVTLPQAQQRYKLGAVVGLRLEVLRRRPDDNLVNFHLGWLLDGVSDRARDRVGRNGLLKGVETEHGFEEVPEEEIIKGYEHTKGHHVLIETKELDALKLEAKHTIDMARFVDRDEIDSRYFEKPYYLLPDGDEADEGYTVLRDALARTKKIAIGQLIMHGREHLVGITAHKKGLVLVILRYADELRKSDSYFRQN